MNVEKLVAKEAIGLLRRKPSKFNHVLGTYLVSFFDCEIGRAGRAAYFFVRHIDDLLDGDRKLKNGKTLDYVTSLRSQIEAGVYTGEPEIIELVAHSLPVLEKKAQPPDSPRQDFLDVIDAMVFDHQRAKKRRVLTAEQLKIYYQQTFFPVINLMLIGLGSKFRACDIPELSFCQGRVYTIRDLQSDWNAGIINIPEEILNGAGLTAHSSYKDVIQSPVQTWFQAELMDCERELLSLKSKLDASDEKLTKKMCGGLINPMLKFIKTSSPEPNLK